MKKSVSFSKVAKVLVFALLALMILGLCLAQAFSPAGAMTANASTPDAVFRLQADSTFTLGSGDFVLEVWIDNTSPIGFSIFQLALNFDTTVLTHVSTVMNTTLCWCTNPDTCEELEHSDLYKPAIAGANQGEGDNPEDGYLLFGMTGLGSSSRMDILAGGGSVMIATITFTVNPSVTHGSQVTIWAGTTEHIPDNNFIERAPTTRYEPMSHTHFSNKEGHEVAPLTVTFEDGSPALDNLAGSVSISGTTAFGATLTAITTALVSDPAGTTPEGFTYQWNRGANPITGATQSTYVPTLQDIGQQLTVSVQASNLTGTVTSAPTTVVTKAEPIISWPTNLTANFGQMLSNVSLPGNGTSSILGSFSWVLTPGTTSVGNAGSPTFELRFTPDATFLATYETITEFVTVTVNKINGTGTPTANLAGWTLPATGGSPSVSVQRSPEQTSATAIFEYQLNGAGAWVSVQPSTAGTHSVRARWEESTNYLAHETAVASFTILAQPAISGVPTISGTHTFLQTLTANTTALVSSPAGTPLGTLSYQWLRGGVEIDGAISSTYVINNAQDAGAIINVRVTASNLTGSVTSANATAVAKATPTPAWPSGLTATFGQTLANVNLPTVAGGTFSWTSGTGTSVGAVGAQSHNVTFTPENTTTHEIVSQNVTVTVSAISIANAVLDIDAPVGGETPSTVVTATPITPVGFTIGTVVWTPTHGTFIGGTAYTVTITLTAEPNYIFPAGFSATISGSSATVSGAPGASVTVSRTFAPTGAPELSGTVTISGNEVFGQTLTANTSALVSDPEGTALGTLTYQWLRNGSLIGGANNATYVLGALDVGQAISVRVYSANCDGEVTSAPTGAIDKAAGAVVILPAVTIRTATRIAFASLPIAPTGQTVEVGYNLTNTPPASNSSVWQANRDFQTGLDPNTTYYFFIRSAESATHHEYVSSGVAEATAKATLTGVPTITGTPTFGNTLTAGAGTLASTPVIPELGALSYEWLRGDTVIAGANSATYTLVAEDVGQQIRVRISTANCDGSVASLPTTAVARTTGATLTAPSIDSHTASTVTLIAHASLATGQDLMYAVSTSSTAPAANATGLNAWQSSLSFTGLNANTNYYFFVSALQSDTHARSVSTGTLQRTGRATLAGEVVITGNTYFGQILTANVDGLESDPIGATFGAFTYVWKRGETTVGGNSPNYTLVQADIGQTLTVTVTSANCDGFVVSSPTAEIAKAPQNAPNAPQLLMSSDTSITLVAISGAEYSIDNGANWQSSAIFAGLTAGETYTFVARLAETDTHLASPNSSSSADIVAQVHKTESSGKGEFRIVPTKPVHKLGSGNLVIEIWIENNSSPFVPVTQYQIPLIFDATVLTHVSTVMVDHGGSGDYMPSILGNDPANGMLVFGRTAGGSEATGISAPSFLIATITFTVNSGVNDGDLTVIFSDSYVAFANAFVGHNFTGYFHHHSNLGDTIAPASISFVDVLCPDCNDEDCCDCDSGNCEECVCRDCDTCQTHDSCACVACVCGACATCNDACAHACKLCADEDCCVCDTVNCAICPCDDCTVCQTHDSCLCVACVCGACAICNDACAHICKFCADEDCCDCDSGNCVICVCDDCTVCQTHDSCLCVACVCGACATCNDACGHTCKLCADALCCVCDTINCKECVCDDCTVCQTHDSCACVACVCGACATCNDACTHTCKFCADALCCVCDDENCDFCACGDCLTHDPCDCDCNECGDEKCCECDSGNCDLCENDICCLTHDGFCACEGCPNCSNPELCEVCDECGNTECECVCCAECGKEVCICCACRVDFDGRDCKFTETACKERTCFGCECNEILIAKDTGNIFEFIYFHEGDITGEFENICYCCDELYFGADLYEIIDRSKYVYDQNREVFLINVAGYEEIIFILKQFTNYLENPDRIRLLDRQKNVIDASEYDSRFIGTGMTIQLLDRDDDTIVIDEVIVVIKGDVNGDGVLNISDGAAIVSHMSVANILSGAFRISADVNSDGVINIADRAAVISHMSLARDLFAGMRVADDETSEPEPDEPDEPLPVAPITDAENLAVGTYEEASASGKANAINSKMLANILMLTSLMGLCVYQSKHRKREQNK
ncbi:MAG: dockerin type I domain-containing protein [Firmicutes bacterium]|nr:dockerin type I domain-containing protein [Bacillota bacterium]